MNRGSETQLDVGHRPDLASMRPRFMNRGSKGKGGKKAIAAKVLQ